MLVSGRFKKLYLKRRHARDRAADITSYSKRDRRLSWPRKDSQMGEKVEKTPSDNYPLTKGEGRFPDKGGIA